MTENSIRTAPSGAAPEAPPSAAGRVRRIAFTTVAAIASLLTALLSFGPFGQVMAGVGPDGDPLTADHRLALLVHVPWLALGWCAAFVSMLWQAHRRVAAYQQTVAMLVGLYLSGLVLAQESDPVFYVGFGGVVLALGLLHPARRTLFRPGGDGISPVLVPFALALAAPCTLYAIQMTDRQQEVGLDGPFYLGIASTALAVPLLALVAGLRAPGWRLPLWAAGGTLALLVGTGVPADPAAPASPAVPWALAGLVAAIAFVAVGEWEAARLARRSAGEPSPSEPAAVAR
jgi:hypothetical protein